MSDDSTKDQRVAQAKHASEIHAESSHMRAFGMSRASARLRLSFIKSIQERQVVQQRDINKRPDAPNVTTSPHGNFYPRKFEVKQNNGATGSSREEKDDKQVIFVDNGTANYYNIPAEFVSAV